MIISLAIQAAVLFIIAVIMAIIDAGMKARNTKSYTAKYLICFAIIGLYALVQNGIVLIFAIFAGAWMLFMSVRDIDYQEAIGFRDSENFQNFMWMLFVLILAGIAVFSIVAAEMMIAGMVLAILGAIVLLGSFFSEDNEAKDFFRIVGIFLIIMGLFPWLI